MMGLPKQTLYRNLFNGGWRVTKVPPETGVHAALIRRDFALFLRPLYNSHYVKGIK